MRQKIVEAARKRFTHYGYSKTTMAEVASDCNMSPGNLYRYFPGKLDIAEEIGNEVYQRLRVAARKAVDAAGPGAADRLKAFLRSVLDFTYEHVEINVKLHELGQFLRKERPEFWTRFASFDRTELTRFLEEGQKSGEFVLSDPAWIADVIRTATLRFRFPQIYERVPLDRLHRELDTLLNLILAGIRPAPKGGETAAESRSERTRSEITAGENFVL
jgi:AcrR family transcriptional regulator